MTVSYTHLDVYKRQTVLRVRLFQVRAIAGGDSYEEINYRDQSLSEPLPFIVKYPDEQS